MSQKEDTGLNTNPWPKLVDHYMLMFYLPCNFFIIKNASDYGGHFNVIILNRLMLGYNKLTTTYSLKVRYKFCIHYD